MKKTHGLAILGVLFVLFCAISLIPSFEHTKGFWVSFLFGLISIAFQFPVWSRALGHRELKSKFMGLPIIYVSVVYLILQVIASLAIMVSVVDSPKLPLLIGIVLLALALLGIISGEAARASIERTERTINAKVSGLREIQRKVEFLIDEENDGDTKVELQRLVEEIRFSDPMSNDTLEPLEAQIDSAIDNLRLVEMDKLEAIGEIRRLLKNRNRLVKNYK